jgi:hypothetical protein
MTSRAGGWPSEAMDWSNEDEVELSISLQNEGLR